MQIATSPSGENKKNGGKYTITDMNSRLRKRRKICPDVIYKANEGDIFQPFFWAIYTLTLIKSCLFSTSDGVNKSPDVTNLVYS